MASQAGVSGPAVAAIAGGVLLVASGVTNQKLTTLLADLVAGRPPTPGPRQSFAFGVGTPDSSSPGLSAVGGGDFPAATGSAIADTALKYRGHVYRFGGAPGLSGAGPWDCSSFVNWVLGHDLGHTLPGSSRPGYSGASHGPTTMSYALWAGASTVGSSGAVSAPGDLCVWIGHMGIAIGGGQMISATGPDGTPSTVIGHIDGGGRGPVRIRRLHG